MDYLSAQNLIVDKTIEYGLNILGILSAVIILSLGVLLFGWGWNKFQEVMLINMSDRSMRIGGFYMWKTPWKGYNRWRSQKWNNEHTL